LQRRKVEFRESRVIEHGDQHRRHGEGERAFLALEQFEVFERVEGDERNQRAAQIQTKYHAAQAPGYVKERHRRHVTLACPQIAARAGDMRLIDQVEMREHDAFGEAGRAAGVLHHRHVVRADARLSGFQFVVGDTVGERHHV
jgi:hypothetical protein